MDDELGRVMDTARDTFVSKNIQIGMVLNHIFRSD